MRLQHFLDITIRARFAFGICCIENAIERFNLAKLNWELVFDFLWKYPLAKGMKGLEHWLYNEGECIPYCILNNLSYEQIGFEYITKEQYNTFLALYKNSNTVICELIDLTSQIGTQPLYGGVEDGAKLTLDYLNNIIDLMKANKILFLILTNSNNSAIPNQRKMIGLFGENH